MEKTCRAVKRITYWFLKLKVNVGLEVLCDNNACGDAFVICMVCEAFSMLGLVTSMYKFVCLCLVFPLQLLLLLNELASFCACDLLLKFRGFDIYQFILHLNSFKTCESK